MNMRNTALDGVGFNTMLLGITREIAGISILISGILMSM